jgi:hypothetical protein
MRMERPRRDGHERPRRARTVLCRSGPSVSERGQKQGAIMKTFALACCLVMGGFAMSVAQAADPPVGPLCDGSTPDDTAIQSLINAARTHGGVGRRINLPAGKCVISTTLVLRGVGGMTLQGQGAVATELVWRGNATSAMFLLDHTFRAKLSDFSITPGDSFFLKTAIRIENGEGCSADP